MGKITPLSILFLIVCSSLVQSVKSDLQCVSCVYMQNSPEISNEGCQLNPPPRKYLRSDCFGFGNLQIAGAIRHSSGSDHSEGNSSSVHCVSIKGITDIGNIIIFRGCDTLEENYEKEHCITGQDFPFPNQGYVKNIKKCFCKTDGCNGATPKDFNAGVILFIIIIPLIYSHLRP